MKGAGPGMRAVRCSLRCYPDWWRQRYGAEQEELAEELAAEGRPHWLLAVGLLAGSVRARMTGSGMPPVPALWSSRARASVVVGTIPAVLALPLELAFVGAVSEYGWSGQGSTAAMRESGAGATVHWEVTALFVLWLVCAAQLLVAGIHVGRGLWPLSPGRRLTTVAVVAAPLAAVVLGLSMIRFSASLQPVVSGEERNLITGATHFYYLRRGNPLAATTLLWGGWTVGVGGWAVGLLAFGRLAARSNLSAEALQVAVSNARMTALTQASFVLGLVALGVTMTLQTPIGPDGGLIYVSRFGPLAFPVLLMLAAIAALSLSGAASARRASAQWGRLRSKAADGA